MYYEIFYICAAVFPFAAIASLGISSFVAVRCDAKTKSKNIKKKSFDYECKRHQRRVCLYTKGD